MWIAFKCLKLVRISLKEKEVFKSLGNKKGQQRLEHTVGENIIATENKYGAI